MIQAMMQRVNGEHFDTPEHAVKPLIDMMLYYGVSKRSIIWECTDTYGRSGISTAFRKEGFDVESTNFDFLECSVEGAWDIIVTNPPFSKKTAFLRRCIEYGKPFALLLPLTALEGIQRHALWQRIEDDFGLMVLDRRVDFTGGGVWFNTSWFTYKIFKGVRFVQVNKGMA
jgi:hypothetical protein